MLGPKMSFKMTAVESAREKMPNCVMVRTRAVIAKKKAPTIAEDI